MPTHTLVFVVAGVGAFVIAGILQYIEMATNDPGFEEDGTTPKRAKWTPLRTIIMVLCIAGGVLYAIGLYLMMAFHWGAH